MIRRGWKEFRRIGCRRTILVVYDVLWFLGLEISAATLLHNEMRFHCNISREDLSKALGLGDER